MDRTDEFYHDLDALKEKWPQVFFDIWTPNDFEGGPFAGDADVDWDDPRHIELVYHLAALADAEHGVTWDTLAQAIERRAKYT